MPDGRLHRPGGPSPSTTISFFSRTFMLRRPDGRTGVVNRGVGVGAMCTPTDVSRALATRITDVCHVHKPRRERERKKKRERNIRVRAAAGTKESRDFLDDYYYIPSQVL